MFRCALGHTSAPREKRTLIVVESRERTYEGKNPGEGWEIVREAPLCPEHVALHEREQQAEHVKELFHAEQDSLRKARHGEN